MALSEYADWWDQQKAISEKFLTEWVQENPQWWAVGIAATVQTTMDVGAGMVDVLRLGEGAAEGGWRGYGKDALRLLAIVGPLGRAGGMLSRFVHVRLVRLAVKPVGMTGPCTFQAVNNAMTITGGRARNLFLTAQDAAQALGKPLAGLPKVGSKYKLAAWIDDLVPFLRSQGAKIKTYIHPTTVDEAAQIAKTENGVVVFAIRCTTTTGKKVVHSIIAVRDELGQIRFADYGGRLTRSVSELVKNLGYGPVDGKGIQLITKANPVTVIDGLNVTGLMENAMAVFTGAVIMIEGVTAIETTDGADLAVPVVTAATSEPTKLDPATPEVVKASFDAFKARKQGQPVIRLPEIRIKGHAPPRADWLTGVQYRLNALAFAAGPVDGIMGPRTKKAVLAFQGAYPPLQVDGIPGPLTQAKLVEVCGY
jgi:hypothetical protein